MLTAATIVAAVALLAAGWIIRIAVSGSPSHTAGGSSSAGTSHGPPPASSNPPRTFYREHGLGPVMGPPAGAPGAPAGPGITPIQPPSGVPFVALSGDTGDPDTGFVVIGLNWPVGSTVTITLDGVRASPVHPLVDRSGTFNYVLNQTHEFFARGLRPGTYTVVVTDTAGGSASARFKVSVSG